MGAYKAVRNRLLLMALWGWASIHRLAMRLDDWLDPTLAETAVRRPLFVIGVPRSGTTLCHRLLAADREVFTTMPLWELLLAPALCEKRLLRRLRKCDRLLGGPLSALLDCLQRRFAGNFDAIHATDLFAPEEDYLALLPYGGCFLEVIARPKSPRVWRLGHFSSQLREAEQQRLLGLYRKIIQRHLAFRGPDRRYLAKNPSLTSWLPGLANAFPDACFLGLRRDPERVVASQLSSLRDAMAWWGHDVRDPAIVDSFVDLLASYWRTLESARAGADASRYRLLEYDALVGDALAVLRQTLIDWNYHVAEDDWTWLSVACRRQSRYRSQHRYRLEDFGLDAARIARAFQASSDGEPQTQDPPRIAS